MPDMLPTVDVIICIHNALDDVKNCISSVEKTNYPEDQIGIILVDDGSDKPTEKYLQKVAKNNSKIKLIRRPKAGGYTVAANTGLKASMASYCALLNSDTIVPKNWIKKIVAIFQQYPDVGIVGPLSNAASWQSVPDLSNPKGGWAINELPNGWSVDDMDRCVEDCYNDMSIIPRVPLLNGFCFVLDKKVTHSIGLMDDVGFPRGFGEEDDFCMRAENAGFGLMVAINTYVYHAKSKSYGSKKRNELSKKGGEVLRQKHGEARILRSVESMKKNPYFREIRTIVSEKM